MILKSIGIQAAFVTVFAFLSTACGHPKPNLTDEDVQAAITPCPNAIQAQWDEGVSAETAMVDGQAGVYHATTVDFYIDDEVLGQSVHATESLHGTIARPSANSGPQYSLGLTCQKGIITKPVAESLAVPDSIDRKTGTTLIETENFTLQYQGVTNQSSVFFMEDTLDGFFYHTSYGGLSGLDSKIVQSGVSFDVLFKATHMLLSSALYGKIHFELDPQPVPQN